jgi:hypothetical protein
MSFYRLTTLPRRVQHNSLCGVGRFRELSLPNRNSDPLFVIQSFDQVFEFQDLRYTLIVCNLAKIGYTRPPRRDSFKDGHFV